MNSFVLKFKDIREMRMGSPFNIAKVVLLGNYIPSFDGFEFQDRGVVSADGRYCYLVQWDIQENSPGFRVWIIDGQKEKTSVSERYVGGCQGINQISGGIQISIWSWNDIQCREETRQIEIQLADFW